MTVTARGRKAIASGDAVAAAVEREVFGINAAELLDVLQRGLAATSR